MLAGSISSHKHLQGIFPFAGQPRSSDHSSGNKLVSLVQRLAALGSFYMGTRNSETLSWTFIALLGIWKLLRLLKVKAAGIEFDQYWQ